MSRAQDEWEGGARQKMGQTPWSAILTQDEEEKFLKCMNTIPTGLHIFSGVLGGVVCAATCSKVAPKYYARWVGIVGGITSMFLSKFMSVRLCFREAAPSLVDPNNRAELNARLAASRQMLLGEAKLQNPPTEALEETTTLPSALEFDDPLSSIQSFSDLTPDQTLEETEMPVQMKKPITYEELRRQHREEYKNEVRNRQTIRTREPIPEQPRSAEQPYRRRTKYGDEME